MFPLITNDRELAPGDVLQAYKGQPMIEKRFEQLKTVLEAAPVLLKDEGRIEALFTLYYLALLVQALIERRLDFLSANRFPLTDPRAMGFANRFGNRVLTVAAALLFSRPIRDSQSGMWIFHRRALERLRLTSDGMAFSEEIKLEALLRGLRFGEEHIPYGRRAGQVKLQKWRDGWRNLTFLFRKRLERT